VIEGSWDRVEAGDLANLDGRGSIFPVDAVDSTLTERMAQLDIHPTGPLWGRGEPLSRHRIADLETRIAGQFQQPCALTADAGMDQERRALRLAVRDLAWEREPGRPMGQPGGPMGQPSALVIRFRLTRGSFATTVLREIIESSAPLDVDGAEEA
jgi:tRNA pseudouridine13 synthase